MEKTEKIKAISKMVIGAGAYVATVTLGMREAKKLYEKRYSFNKYALASSGLSLVVGAAAALSGALISQGWSEHYMAEKKANEISRKPDDDEDDIFEC